MRHPGLPTWAAEMATRAGTASPKCPQQGTHYSGLCSITPPRKRLPAAEIGLPALQRPGTPLRTLGGPCPPRSQCRGCSGASCPSRHDQGGASPAAGTPLPFPEEPPGSARSVLRRQKLAGLPAAAPRGYGGGRCARVLLPRERGGSYRGSAPPAADSSAPAPRSARAGLCAAFPGLTRPGVAVPAAGAALVLQGWHGQLSPGTPVPRRHPLPSRPSPPTGLRGAVCTARETEAQKVKLIAVLRGLGISWVAFPPLGYLLSPLLSRGTLGIHSPLPEDLMGHLA